MTPVPSACAVLTPSVANALYDYQLNVSEPSIDTFAGVSMEEAHQYLMGYLSASSMLIPAGVSMFGSETFDR